MLEVLEKQIRNNVLSHAYLFIGSKYQDKLTEALKFINLLKIYPEDLNIIDHPYSETIKIEEIKNIQHILNLKPYRSPYKAVIINHAERMTTEAANSLLKTLEEPAGYSILILLSSQEDILLPTIVSRCQKIRLKLNEEKLNFDPLYSLIAIKKLELKEKFDLANQLSKQDNLEEIFDSWLLEARKILRSNLPKKQKNLKKDLNFLLWAYDLLGTNANRRLILENLFLELE